MRVFCLSMSKSLEINQPAGISELLLKMPGHLLNAPFPSDTDVWRIDGIEVTPGSFDSYEMSFAPFLDALGAETFQKYLGVRKQQGKTTDVLDPFGGGYAIRELGVMDSMTAVRLKNIDIEVERRLVNAYEQELGTVRRSQLMEDLNFLRAIRGSGKREVIEGNLFRFSTWNKVRDSALRRGISGFDLIICRPDGAFSSTQEEVDQNIMTGSDHRAGNTVPYKFLFLSMFNEAYSLLRDDGVLFTEVPEVVVTKDELQSIQTVVNQASGVRMDTAENYVGANILMLQKERGAALPLTPTEILEVRRRVVGNEDIQMAA